MSNPVTVTIVLYGERQVHAVHPKSEQITLCNHYVNGLTLPENTPPDKIDCPYCKAVWLHAAKYNPDQFK